VERNVHYREVEGFLLIEEIGVSVPNFDALSDASLGHGLPCQVNTGRVELQTHHAGSRKSLGIVS
jgi:hypothetical protein